MNNNTHEKQLVIGVIFISLILALFIFYIGKEIVVANLNKSKIVATTTNESKTKPLTVNSLLTAFSDWEKTGFTKSPIMLVIKNKATLTIMEENEYVKWAEVIVIAPNIKAETLTDNELVPIKKLLYVILPDWKEGESWLKNNLSNLPASNTEDKWQLRLTYSDNTGLTLLASQTLPPVDNSYSSTGNYKASQPSDVVIKSNISGDWLVINGQIATNTSTKKRTLYVYAKDSTGNQHFIDAVYVNAHETGNFSCSKKISQINGPPPYKIVTEWK